MKMVFLFLLVSLPTWAASVTLTWDKNPETDIAGYRIWYGTGTRNYTNMTQAPTNRLTITNLVGKGPFYFAATALNTSGLESDFSNEVIVTPPAIKPGAPKSLTSSLVTASWRGKTNNRTGNVAPIAILSGEVGTTSITATISGPGWSLIRSGAVNEDGVLEIQGKSSVPPFVARIDVTSVAIDPWFKSEWAVSKQPVYP